MHAPQILWVDVLHTIAYLMNHILLRILWFKRPLKLLLCFTLGSSIPPKVFGCISDVNFPKFDCSKLELKTLKCIFLRYALNQKGYKHYHLSTQKRIDSMDITFHETISFFSASQPHLQEEKCGVCEDKATLPLHVPLYSFNVDGCHNLCIPLMLMDVITRGSKRLFQRRQHLLKINDERKILLMCLLERNRRLLLALMCHSNKLSPL